MSNWFALKLHNILRSNFMQYPHQFLRQIFDLEYFPCPSQFAYLWSTLQQVDLPWHHLLKQISQNCIVCIYNKIDQVCLFVCVFVLQFEKSFCQTKIQVLPLSQKKFRQWRINFAEHNRSLAQPLSYLVKPHLAV